jgi:hypothetical protein
LSVDRLSIKICRRLYQQNLLRIVNNKMSNTNSYNSKTNLKVLNKKNGRRDLDEWKRGVMSECNKTDVDDAYVLAQLPSDHLTKSVPMPVQTNYKNASGNDDIAAFRKQFRAWTQMESNAEGIMLRHLEGELKDVFVNTVKTKPVHDGYEAVLLALLMDDISQGLSLENQLDGMRQKPNESALEYLARVRKIGNDLMNIKPNETVAITAKMSSKLYYGMNDETSKSFWGIIKAADASADFSKMETIIEKNARDEEIRAAIHGDVTRHGAALAANQGNRNRGNCTRNMGQVVPGKLFISNLPFGIGVDAVRSAFARFGTLTDVNIPVRDGRPAGYAFVTYADPANAIRAKTELNDKELGGRRIRIREYRDGNARGDARQAQELDDELPSGFALAGVEVVDDVDSNDEFF